MKKFDFLKSTRFWAIVIGAVSFYLNTKGIFGDAEMILVATITSGFTVVRTIDRQSDVKAAAITGDSDIVDPNK